MKPLWVRKGTIEEEEEADREFWQQMTGLERLEALEELQREIWGHDATSNGLRRVARVVERDPPHRIDLITSLKAVEFEEAWEGRVEDSIGDVKVCILGIPELIRNKKAVGRPQDQADVAVLEAFHKPKP